MSDIAESYPPVGFAFKMQLHGDNASGDMGFQEVSGMSVSMGNEAYAEGGNNRFVHQLPSVPTYSNLILKRGYVTRELPLFQWCKSTLSSNFAKPIKPRQFTLSLLNPAEPKKPLKSWTFYRARPVKWSLGEFESSKNQVLIETLEFSYDYFDQN